MAEQTQNHNLALAELTTCRAALEIEVLDLQEAVGAAEASVQSVVEESTRQLAATEAGAASAEEAVHQSAHDAREAASCFEERATAAEERATQAHAELQELQRAQGEQAEARTNLESHKHMIRTLQQRLAELESQSQGERLEADRRFSDLQRKHDELQHNLSSSGKKELTTIGAESRAESERLQSSNSQNVARDASGDPHGGSGGQGTHVVDDQIAVLEKRCQSLQRKLNTRPIVYQAPVEDLENPTSAPATSTSFVSVLRETVEAPLRSFTRRLLKRDSWLFVFYVHLFFLYMVVASCLGSTSLAGNGSIDCVNLRMTQWEPTAMAQPLAAITSTPRPAAR
jgi:DNA repair exonuclease SbcCD ATPase subunit